MKHLFLHGPSGAGKSFALGQAIAERGLPVRGFRSHKAADGFVYLGPAGAPAPEDAAHRVACISVRPPVADAARFDALGAALLGDIRPGELVLMDEIGFLERDAAGFSALVRALLDRTDVHILGVCRADKDTPLLCYLRGHANVALYAVTPATRDAALARARAFLRQL